MAKKNKSIKPPPPFWGDDELSFFLSEAQNSTFATFHNQPRVFDLFRRLHSGFELLLNNLKNSKEFLPVFFIFRSHSAYLTCTRLALSSQASETYLLMRYMLEYGLYGLMIKSEPTLGDLWQKRQENSQIKREVRNAFTPRKLLANLETIDPILKEEIGNFFEVAIDFGAHPNPLNLFGALKLETNEEGLEFTTHYLHGHSQSYFSSMLFTLKAGVASLKIAHHIVPERSSILGIPQALSDMEFKIEEFGKQFLKHYSPELWRDLERKAVLLGKKL